MKIQTKLSVLLALAFAAFLLFLSGYLYVRNQELSLFQESRIETEKEIIGKVLDFKAENMLMAVIDNSVWDGAVHFTENKDTVWANSNFEVTRQTFDMSYFNCYDASGNLIYSAYNGSSPRLDIPPLQIQSWFHDNHAIHSFLFNDGNLFEVFGSDIVPSDDAEYLTEVKGRMIAVKHWDQEYLNRIREATGFQVSVHSFNHVSDQTRSKEVEIIHFPVKDADGEKVCTVEFTRQNELLFNLKSLRYLSVSVLVFLAASVILFFYLTNKLIAYPLKAISKSLRENDPEPVSHLETKTDEFGEIAVLIRNFNAQKGELIQQVITSREATEKYRNIVENSYDIIFTMSREFTLDFVSPAWFSLLGHNVEEVIGCPITQFIHEDDRRKCTDYFKKVVETGQRLEGIEYRIRHTDGKWRWQTLGAHPARNRDGELIGFNGIARDITRGKENEEYNQVLIESLSFGIIRVDPETRRIESVNSFAAEMIGESPVNIIGKKCHQYICPAMENNCPICDLGQSVDNSDRILLNTAGERIPVLKTVKKIVFNGREKLLECFIDISERKKTEEELKEATTRLSLAIRTGSIGIWELDLKNDKMIWDEQMYLLYGLKEDNFGGTYGAWIGTVYHDDVMKVENEIQLAVSGNSEFDTEFRVTRPDNEIRNFRSIAKVTRDVHGEALSIIGTNWDITGQKQSEELQHLLINIAGKFMNLPLDKVEASINQAIREMGEFVNADRAYIFEYNFIQDTCSNTFEWCADGVSAEIGNLQDVPLEYMTQWVEIHRRGEPVYYPDIDALEDTGSEGTTKQILQAQSIKSLLTLPMISEGELLGFVGFDSVKKYHTYTAKEKILLGMFVEMYVNVSNRIHSLEQLSTAKKMAEASSEAKSKFLSNMSHEIRTPLNGVIGYTELLIQTPLKDIQKQYVENVNVSAKALLGIINDILDFSKIEAGKLDLEIISTDIVEMLEHTCDIVKFSAATKGLELLLDISPEMPRLAEIDPVRLKQILINLLNNAVKFTEKGEVKLKVVFTDLGNNRGRFDFLVYDTGIGIHPEQKARLFQAFSQGDNSTTRRFGGTGLGLVISNLLAEKMGGKIEVESEYMKGSVFFFDIETSFRHLQDMGKNEPLKFKRVLVVDDNDNNREILEHNFNHWGIEYVGCDNGLSALQLLEKEFFDLLIVDYHMPYLDGIETIRMMREKLNLKPDILPVIILHSSSDDQNLRDECKKLGIRFNLVKPVKAGELFYFLKNIDAAKAMKPAKESSMQPIINADEGSFITLLIAEDVQINMLLITTICSNLLPGARIIEAVNGDEAVTLYQKNRVDLILMDVQMPVLDGIEATRLIRESEIITEKRVPIIALTAGATKEERERSSRNGMDDYITKPINVEELKEKLEKYLKLNQT